jgi:hypothetical protein
VDGPLAFASRDPGVASRRQQRIRCTATTLAAAAEQLSLLDLGWLCKDPFRSQDDRVQKLIDSM